MLSEQVSLEVQSVFVHELVHVKRQKEHGYFLWNSKYIFLRSFRLQEELAAIEIQMRFLHQSGLIYNVSKKAKEFSDSTYLWVTSFENATALLEDLWQKCSTEKHKSFH